MKQNIEFVCNVLGLGTSCSKQPENPFATHSRLWRHTKRSFLLAALFFLVSSLVVFAVHNLTDVFELDGNATATSADDWDNLSHALATAFIPDGNDPDDTSYFSGGGSKDTNDINQWSHTPNDQAPDKDELIHAFTALYTKDNDVILYFGADRFDSSGNSQIGFWLLQNSIGVNGDGTFSGVHQVGDLLVLSDFVNGGTIPEIKVYEWVGSGGSDGALDLVQEGIDCDNDGSANDNVCATINDESVPVPDSWDYKPKKGKPGQFPTGSFYEGGVNLSAILREHPDRSFGCFNTFLAETRSSPSLDAQLKDFAIGSLDGNLCDAQITVDPTNTASQVSTASRNNAQTFTIHLQKKDFSTGLQWQNVENVRIEAAFTNDDNPAGFVGDAFCLTNSDGRCTITIDSTAAGQSVVAFTPDDPAFEPVTATATWVDARLVVQPDQSEPLAAQVGAAVVATVTLQTDVGGGFVDAPAGQTQGLTVLINDPGTASTTCSGGDNPCAVTVTSATTGQTDASLDWTGEIIVSSPGGDISVPVSAAADLADITWVDAHLTLSPEEAYNVVGTNHQITARLKFDLGDGQGFAIDAPVTETQKISFAPISGVGSAVDFKICDPAGGACTLTITSGMTGTTVVSATWSGRIAVPSGAEPALASTTAEAPAIKHWVAVRVNLEPPQAATQVGNPHPLTATLGFATDAGFAPVIATANTPPLSFSVTRPAGSPGHLSAPDCSFVPGTEASCVVTLTSDSTGLDLVSAAWPGGEIELLPGVTATVTAEPVTATNRWVDAQLSLSPPEAANDISDPHPLTATLTFDLGDGQGFVVEAPQTQTEGISFTITSGPNNPGLGQKVCTDGRCTNILTSDAAGTTVVSATWSGVISTPQGSAIATVQPVTATKLWVEGIASIGTIACPDSFEPPDPPNPPLPYSTPDNDFVEDASPIEAGTFYSACVKSHEEMDVYQLTIDQPSLFTVTVNPLAADVDVIVFVPISPTDDLLIDTSTQVDALGRASAGRASAGRASAGRASAGRASAGRASAGRASAGRASAGRASAGRASAALIGGSFAPGVVSEEAVAVAPEPGVYYILVFRPEGAGKPGPYTFNVDVKGIDTAVCNTAQIPPSPAAQVYIGSNTDPSNPSTLILTHQGRLEALYPTNAGALINKLHQLADNPNVQGIVVPVDTDGAVAAAYGNWTSNYCNIAAANDVSEAIRGLIAAYPSINNVVIAGSDEIIPFHRVPDQASIANEREFALLSGTNQNTSPLFWALAQGYVLSDDFYVDDNPLVWEDGEHKLYIPDDYIGRLAETPDQMIAVIDNYLFNQTVNVQNCVTTGYDFLLDSANSISNTLGGFGTNVTALNNNSWTSTDLATIWPYANPRPDLVSVNAHFEHWNALPAAGSDLFLNTLISGVNNYTNTVAYSMGCHAGLNVPDSQVIDPVTSPDFPQAFAGQSAAAWVANTGFGYGMTETVADSEQLMLLFTDELGKPDGDASIGQALLQAKRRFVDNTGAGGFGVYEEKSMIEATMWGLPMHQLTVPNPQASSAGTTVLPMGKVSGLAQLFAPGPIMVIPGPARPHGSLTLQSYTIPSLQPTRQETTEGVFYKLDEETYVAPGLPVQPRGFVTSNALPCTPRGVLFKGANYDANLGLFDPLVSVPSPIDKLDEPNFSVNGWHPDKFWGLTPLNKNLMFIDGQYNLDGLQERLYTDMTFDIICEDNALGNDGTVIIMNVAHNDDGTDVHFAVEVETRNAAAEGVRLSCDNSTGLWQSLDLTDSTVIDSVGSTEVTRWTGKESLSNIPAGSECMAQAWDNQGHVAVDTGPYRIGVPQADAANPINTTHTFTFRFDVDTGNGFEPVADGTKTVSQASLDFGTIVADRCFTEGTVNGECEIEISSTAPGVSTLTANLAESNVTVSVNGHDVTARLNALSFSAVKEWWAGSISLFKRVELGPTVSNPEICFKLTRTDGALITSSSDRQCVTFGPGNTSYLFQWKGLTAGKYKVEEIIEGPTSAAYPETEPFTNIVVDDANRNVLLKTVNNRPFACDLHVDKQCSVAATADVACDSKIAATLLRYTGPDVLGAAVKIEPQNRRAQAVTYGPVDLISGQTLTPPQGGFTIDSRPDDIGAKMTITIKDAQGKVISKEDHHTSCSMPYLAGQPAPLNSDGSPSPNWTVVSFIEKDGDFVTAPQLGDSCTVAPGTDVTYRYTVTNDGDPLSTVSVFDLPLGQIGVIPTLGTGESQTLTKTKQINDTTLNIATVTGLLENSLSCSAPSDQVTVTVPTPEP